MIVPVFCFDPNNLAGGELVEVLKIQYTTSITRGVVRHFPPAMRVMLGGLSHRPPPPRGEVGRSRLFLSIVFPTSVAARHTSFRRSPGHLSKLNHEAPECAGRGHFEYRT